MVLIILKITKVIFYCFNQVKMSKTYSAVFIHMISDALTCDEDKYRFKLNLDINDLYSCLYRYIFKKSRHELHSEYSSNTLTIFYDYSNECSEHNYGKVIIIGIDDEDINKLKDINNKTKQNETMDYILNFNHTISN